LYEKTLSYQKVIARLQETVEMLMKTDDPSVHMKDISAEHQQLCRLAEVQSSHLFFPLQLYFFL